MSKKVRKEKYVSVQNKKGNDYLVVKFTYWSGADRLTYTKTFAVSDYPTMTEAMNAACKHRDQKRYELSTGAMPVSDDKPLRELLELSLAADHSSAQTKSSYLGYYARYIEPVCNKSIKKVTALDIEQTLGALRFTKSQAVIYYVATTWRRICKTARKLRIITVNPMEEVTIPKSKYLPPEKTKKQVSEDEVYDFLEFLKERSTVEKTHYNDMIMYHCIILMYSTGIRPAEACALRRNDIDLFSCTLRVDETYGTDENGPAVVAPKTPLSARTIPMNSDACESARALLDMSANEFLLTSYEGIHVNTKWLDYRLDDVSRRYGSKPFSFYTLRHELSTRLITKNVDPRTVMELMGHSTVNMTIGTYARSNEDLKKTALEELRRTEHEFSA